ncbi:MAG: hypothetical protein ACO1QS_11525 [Verrucomicrobiota bacterium]
MSQALKIVFRRNALIALALVSLAVLAIWLFVRPQRYHITDVTKPQTIVLQAPHGASYIQAISIRLKGTIDGAALITAGFPSRELSGDFNLHFGASDCYTTNFVLEYTPKGVSRGRVTIHYKFLDTSFWGEMERKRAQKQRTR